MSHQRMVRRWGTVRGYGGPTVLMLNAVDGPLWTKCGSRAWSGGPSMATALDQGGPIVGGPSVV